MTVDLHKRREPMTLSEQILAFLNRHAVEIVFVCIIILFILVFMLFAVLLSTADPSNTTHVSMVESGNYYYHLKDVI